MSKELARDELYNKIREEKLQEKIMMASFGGADKRGQALVQGDRSKVQSYYSTKL